MAMASAPMSDLTNHREEIVWLGWFPPARWLAEYRLAWLPGDVAAGITLAAYAIPVSLAYAGLAGLPPQVGIYGYLLGGVGYALLGSSRQLAIGPTSAISLMIAGTVGAMADGDVQRYAQIACLAAFTVAALSLFAWLLRLSVLVKIDERQYPGGFQGRRRLDHRDDANSEPAWRKRWRTRFFRAGVPTCRPARPVAVFHSLHRLRRRRSHRVG